MKRNGRKDRGDLRKHQRQTSGCFVSVLVPPSFRQQLAPAVQVFCRSEADGGTEGLKRKPSALFSAGQEHVSLLFPCCAGDA